MNALDEFEKIAVELMEKALMASKAKIRTEPTTQLRLNQNAALTLT